MSEDPTNEFCQLYNLENLIKQPTCYKNAGNPTNIDVILTNKKEFFENSFVIETGISDHHKMVITVLKVYVKKQSLSLSRSLALSLFRSLALSISRSLALSPWNMTTVYHTWLSQK